MTLDEVKGKMKDNIGEKVKVVFNGSRNRVEKYDAVILETYPFVFVLEIEDRNSNLEKKSFSYSDILTGSIEITFKDKK